MTQHPTQSPQFFLTAPSPCPYLDGQFERKVFTHLVGDKAPEMNDLLTQGGFRRSQNIAYRPACETCRACVSVRILAQEFERHSDAAVEPLAALRRRQPLAVADEQRLSDPFLELMDALADRGLRDVEFSRAARKASDAMSRLEKDEQIQWRKGGPVLLHSQRL